MSAREGGGLCRVMMLTPEIEERPAGGRALFSALVHDVLHDLTGGELLVHELPRVRATAAGALRGHIDGVSPSEIARLLGGLDAAKVDTLLVDGSNLGEAARAVKKAAPHVRIVTLCHNVEARFFLGAFRRSPRPRAAAVLLANYLAERKAVAASDDLLALTGRDRALLGRVYGREATHVVPLCVRDAFSGHRTESAGGSLEDGYALFVGGAFYANRAGVEWWARHVAPRLGRRTVVVGRGFETLRKDLEVEGRLELVGAVDDLEAWYRGAAYVVAPIFDGSGMKTKVAEALMFGKSVVGTPDAFVGYEPVTANAGRVCATADEFVRADAEAAAFARPGFDPAKRALYDARYSRAALGEHLQRVLRGER